MSRKIKVFPPLFLILILTSYLAAQGTSAKIVGTVADDTGGVLPGVEISATNSETGLVRNAISGNEGRYQVLRLPPGNYVVRGQLAGFSTTRRDITLTVGEEALLNLTLEVGEISEEVVVTGAAPIIDTQSVALSGVVDRRTIEEIPLNGRSFDQLLTLQAGVVNFKDQTNNQSQVFSVGGGRTGTNKFSIDGTEQIGGTQFGTLPNASSGQLLGVEAIREFRVVTNAYSAEYGKKSGAVIDIVTKSGTNQFHGSVFEFHRNDNLDARNFFSQDKAEFKRNQFGFSIGGPIIPDKTFFFGNYEGLRDRLGLSGRAFVPSQDVRNGLLPLAQVPDCGDVRGDLCFVGVHPNVAPYLDLWPLPNGTDFGDGSGEFFNSGSQPTDQDYFVVRVDHQLSDRGNLFGRYLFDDASVDTPDDVPAFEDSLISRNQLLTLEESHFLSSSTVNVFRFGYNRSVRVSDTLPGTDAAANAGPFIPGQPFMGALSLGQSSLGGGATFAPIGAANVPRFFVVNSFDFNDQLTYEIGDHSLKFGVDVQRIQHNEDQGSGQRGNFNFGSLLEFLTNVPTTFRGSPPGQDSIRGWRQTFFGIYVQDDFRFRSNITLNLGLRYEFITNPSEVNGKTSNYAYEPSARGAVIVTEPVVGNPLFSSNSKTKSFGPRLGIAWDPSGDGKMSVRAGAGIFFDQPDGTGYRFLAVNSPFYGLIDVLGGEFPNGLEGPGNERAVAPRTLDIDHKVPTKVHWNLSLQRELPASTAVTVAYVGTSAHHLVRRYEGNTAFPEVLSDGTLFYPGGSRRNPALASATHQAPEATSTYHSFQLDLKRRFSDGVSFTAAYTFSKSIDSASVVFGIEGRNGASTSMIPEDAGRDKGLSFFDVRNLFAGSVVWDIPGGENLAGAASRAFLDGWQVSSIINLSDGVPFNAQTGFNRARNNDTRRPDRPNLAPGASNNPILGDPNLYFDPTAFLLPEAGFYGNLGRTTMIGPGLATVDFAAKKGTSVGEGKEIEFRVEFFNAFNRANFARPLNNLFTSSGARQAAAGRIRSTLTTARQIQVGLKFIF